MTAPPLREIVREHWYKTPSHPNGTFSVRVTLECGHEKYYKGSQKPMRQCRCGECGELAGRDAIRPHHERMSDEKETPETVGSGRPERIGGG